MRRRRNEYFADKECASCRSTDDLELDHVDPKRKVSHRIWSWSAQRRVEELAKCQALCVNCHARKSAEYIKVDHSEDGKHNKRCPCNFCRRRVEQGKLKTRIEMEEVHSQRLSIKDPSDSRRKDFCVNDHEMVDENVYLTPEGRRQCRMCKRIRSRDSHRRVRSKTAVPAETTPDSARAREGQLQ